MTFTRKASTARLFIGFAIVMIAAVLGIILTCTAAGAAGLGFWDLAILNKLGTFLLIWNYNPLAYLGIIALVISGMVLIQTGRR